MGQKFQFYPYDGSDVPLCQGYDCQLPASWYDAGLHEWVCTSCKQRREAASSMGGCPYGCAAQYPVCQQGRQLFENAYRAAQQLPAIQSVSPSTEEWRAFEGFWQAADAYLAHIGQSVVERYE